MFKKICITGATGFIGRNLLKYLLNKNQFNITLIIRDNKSLLVFDDERIDFYLDNSKTDELFEFFKERKFDLVIHLASLYLKDHSPEDITPLIDSNITFGARLLEASNMSDVKAFINTGTFWQHNNNESYSPVNLYSATKQAFEDIAKYYIEAYNMYFVTLKLNDTYGPGDTRKKIFNLWRDLNQNDELNMSPGEQRIDIMYIDDVVSAFYLLIKQIDKDFYTRKYVGKSFSIHNEEIISLKELATMYEKVSRKSLKINWGQLNYREREVMFPWNGGERIENWKQKYSLKNGIKKYIIEDK